MSVRRLIKRVSRGVVIRRTLPQRFGGGSVFVSPEAGGLKMLYPDVCRAEPALFELAEELVRPGDTVWDVGANVGLFAFAAAGRSGSAGRVLAIEPDVWLVSLILRSARAQNAMSA